MSWHKSKRILVGVSGGIAAYKSPTLVRRLIERGCEVRVVMSSAATEFITPLTLQAVSGHPVHQHLLDAEAESGMGHIELARWAEQIIIAPATADFIAKLAGGQADDLLSTLTLASEAEVAVAPAMNRMMWQHPATQRNLTTLAARGIRVIGPGSGEQACGESGLGRMTEPEQIATLLAGDARPRLLDGVEVLITAGPTWEAIDPVRGLTNHSSGKMGYAMAQAALDFGATVTLVSGPVSLETPHRATRVDVVSARQMLDAVEARLAASPTVGLFIAVAAVADYRPAVVAAHKIKKEKTKKPNARTVIELVENPDILAQVAARKDPPLTIGFAAETENVLANARQKLAAKGADVIAVNQIATADCVFDSDQNAVTLIYRDQHKTDEVALERTDKYRLAVQIIEHIAPLFERRVE